MKIGDTILNFIFPPTCHGCDESVEKRGDWCSKCLSENVCFRHLKGDKILDQLIIGGCYSIAKYNGPAGELIRNLKYKKQMECRESIHTLVNEAFRQTAVKKKILRCDVAMAVPLHEDKLKARGFNQAEVIFRKPLKKLGISWVDCLSRKLNTKPQYGLQAGERRNNLQEAFAVDRIEIIKGKDVLLVDDIMTTGTTLIQCASLLMRSGAATVTALVLASDREM